MNTPTRRKRQGMLMFALRTLVRDYTPARRTGPVTFTNGSAIMRRKGVLS